MRFKSCNAHLMCITQLMHISFLDDSIRFNFVDIESDGEWATFHVATRGESDGCIYIPVCDGR